MSFSVYILRSNKLDRFYIGFTTDLSNRLIFHLTGEESRKFTAKAKDWKLFLHIEFSSKQQAMAIVKHIKKMKSAKYIHNLKRYPEIIDKLLLKYSEG